MMLIRSELLSSFFSCLFCLGFGSVRFGLWCDGMCVLTYLFVLFRQGPLVLGEEGKVLRKKVWGNIVDELSLVDDDVKHVVEEWSGLGMEASK